MQRPEHIVAHCQIPLCLVNLRKFPPEFKFYRSLTEGVNKGAALLNGNDISRITYVGIAKICISALNLISHWSRVLSERNDIFRHGCRKNTPSGVRTLLVTFLEMTLQCETCQTISEVVQFLWLLKWKQRLLQSFLCPLRRIHSPIRAKCPPFIGHGHWPSPGHDSVLFALPGKLFCVDNEHEPCFAGSQKGEKAAPRSSKSCKAVVSYHQRIWRRFEAWRLDGTRTPAGSSVAVGEILSSLKLFPQKCDWIHLSAFCIGKTENWPADPCAFFQSRIQSSIGATWFEWHWCLFS